MALIKMKETADAYLGKNVTYAVVTVPARTSIFRVKHRIYSHILCDIQTSRTHNAR